METVLQRQTDYIDQLQDELKNAKIILQDRNLRGKFFERLQDYKNDIERNKIETTKASNIQIIHRRVQSAHKASSRGSSSKTPQKIKPNSASIQQKYTNRPGSIFNTFDYSSHSFTPITLNIKQFSFNPA